MPPQPGTPGTLHHWHNDHVRWVASSASGTRTTACPGAGRPRLRLKSTKHVGTASCAREVEARGAHARGREWGPWGARASGRGEGTARDAPGQRNGCPGVSCRAAARPAARTHQPALPLAALEGRFRLHQHRHRHPSPRPHRREAAPCTRPWPASTRSTTAHGCRTRWAKPQRLGPVMTHRPPRPHREEHRHWRPCVRLPVPRDHCPALPPPLTPAAAAVASLLAPLTPHRCRGDPPRRGPLAPRWRTPRTRSPWVGGGGCCGGRGRWRQCQTRRVAGAAGCAPAPRRRTC